jgi:chromosome segregation ATPase
MARIERESINFKLPKPLADALRTAAAQRDTTATDLVIKGLNHILGDVPGVESSVEVRLYQLEEEFFSLKSSLNEGSTNSDSEALLQADREARLTRVESKLEELSNKLARFEGALNAVASSVNSSNSRRSGSYSNYNQHNSRPPQIEPHDEPSLCRRLNTNAATLAEKRATCSQKEFDRWCKDRDNSEYAWHFNEKDGLYHPVK